MIDLKTDPALRRPAPAGVLQEVRRQGSRRRRAALAAVGGACTALVAVALLPALLSTASDQSATPGTTALAPAAPDLHRATYALTKGTLTQDTEGHHGTLHFDRLVATKVSDAFGWTATSKHSNAFTVQLDSEDALHHITSVDLFVPPVAGQSATAFQFTPDTPVSLNLRVGEISTGTWTRNGHLFTLTCSRPQVRVWRIKLATVPSLSDDISPASLDLEARQSSIEAGSPLDLALHARYGNGGTLDVELRGKATPPSQ